MTAVVDRDIQRVADLPRPPLAAFRSHPTKPDWCYAIHDARPGDDAGRTWAVVFSKDTGLAVTWSLWTSADPNIRVAELARAIDRFEAEQRSIARKSCDGRQPSFL